MPFRQEHAAQSLLVMDHSTDHNGVMETQQHFDVIVVGAGIGGIYTLHRMKQQGLSTLCLESASGVGGVWFHNRYPGARVDVESYEYCYHFSSELFSDWRWTERYAAQPELLRYFNFIVDRLDLRDDILLNTAMQSARWHPDEARYHVETATGMRLTCRFLIMATGNLSAARKPDFPGLEDYKGEWAQASHWPDRDVPLAGRRVAVIGTGSSGVQTIPVIAEQAESLTVFQRSPNFSVPARNGPFDPQRYAAIAADLPAKRSALLATRAGITSGLPPFLTYAEFTPEEQQARLERQWQHGGQGMNRVFTDQSINQEVNDAVAEFVRSKIREIVKDPETAEKLSPRDHPIGSRRLCVDTDYYATYNRDNVTLVDISAEPIERITETGIRTSAGEYEVDLIVFALGFNAFSGAMERVDIRNEKNETPTGSWHRGPRTLLGLMTDGFPNFFFLTGPGSPSVLSNLVIMNEEHADWVADVIAHMDANGYDTVEATTEAIDAWSATVAEAASKLLRLGVKNYMVHVNEDGSRVFMPYVGGVDRYREISLQVAADGYPGFAFKTLAAAQLKAVG
jgi:cation diffusion facilitator CzcD-associated flavoprotein CzcO